MRCLPVLLALIVACSPSGDDDSGTSPTGSTGTPTGTATTSTADGAIVVDCSVQPDNVLRYDCTATTLTAGALDVSWAPVDGGDSRGFTTSSTGTDHSFTVYAMKAQVDYRVEFTGPDGTAALRLTPDALPASVEPAISTTGTGSTPVLMVLPCASSRTVAIADTDGALLWYQVVGGAGGSDGAAHFTPQGTVLTSMDSTIREYALDGTELVAFVRGTDFDDVPLHHDVHRGGNGLIYALFAEQVGSYISDGLLVFDESGLIDSWHLSDVLTPGTGGGGGAGGGFWGQEFPNATDWSHGNSIHVDASGTGWLSFRHLSTAMQLDADPASGSFGSVDWTMVGETNGITSDFTISSTDGNWSDFDGQHHVNPTPDGRLALFDNRTGTEARGIVMDVDPVSGTAVIEESWPVGQSCPAQGATYVLDSGNAVITCGPQQLVQEFEPGNDTAVWSLDLTCTGGGPAILPRGMPAPI